MMGLTIDGLKGIVTNHVLGLFIQLRVHVMPNIVSAKKRVLQSEKHRIRNVSLRSGALTYLKKARKAIASGVVTDAQVAVKEAFSKIDKMVPKGVFHKNKAARLKSRLNAALKKKVLAVSE